MNIEIFELKYLQFILSSVWNFLGFIVILLIVTNWMGWLFSVVGGFLKKVKSRYRKLGVPDKLSDKIKTNMPNFLKEQG